MHWHDIFWGALTYLSIGGMTTGIIAGLDDTDYYNTPRGQESAFTAICLWPVAFPMVVFSYLTKALRRLPDSKHRRRLEYEQLRHQNAMKELESANRLLED